MDDYDFVNAAESGNIEIISRFIEDGHDLNEEFYGEGLIHTAAFNSQLTVVESLLNTGRVDVNVKSAVGWTPLHYAVASGHLETVAFLIDKGSDINAISDSKESPLYLASERNQVDTISFLLSKNADFSVGKSALAGAAVGGKSQAFFLLVKHLGGKGIDDDRLLTDACFGNNPEIVKYLLDRGIKPATENKQQPTALHHAAEKGSIEIVQMLLHSGASVEVEDFIDYGLKTPLHYAAENGPVEIIELLLDKDANPNILDRNGKTPLHCAAERNKRGVDVAAMLINRGCDINLQDADGFTALHYAADEQEPTHWESVEEPVFIPFLLNAGANVNVKTYEKGLTPLMIAVRNGAMSNVRMMLSKGAEIDDQDYDGWTALHHAVFYNYPEMVEILLKAGCSILECKVGRTALYLAEVGSPRSGPFLKLVKMLKKHRFLKKIGLRKTHN